MKIALLLNANAKPNKADSGGRTPLHWAARNGHTEVTKLLLDAAAHPNVRDREGETALYKAAYYGHTDVVKALLFAENI